MLNLKTRLAPIAASLLLLPSISSLAATKASTTSGAPYLSGQLESLGAELDTQDSPLVSNQTGEEKYFGYWGSARVGYPNHSSTLKGITNTLWVSAPNLRDTDAWIEKIQIAESNGQKVVLDIRDVIFVSKDDLRLRADAASLWANFYDQVIVRYRDRVVGLNVADEPFFNNMRLPETSRLTNEQVTANIQRVIAMIKKSDSTLITMMTFGGLEAEKLTRSRPVPNGYYPYPESIDWVGYNCYAVLAPICPIHRIVPRWENLRRLLKPEGRLIFTMDALGERNDVARSQSESLRYDKIYASYISRHFDQVAGIFPFIYQTGVRPGKINPKIGASEMPRVEFWLNSFGQYVMERGGSVTMPTGLFKQTKKRRTHLYSVSSQGYCEFENLAHFSHLVEKSSRRSLKSLRTTWPGIEPKNPFLGKCTADMTAPVTQLTATRVSSQSAQLSWSAPANAARFAVVMAEKGKSLPACSSGAARETRDQTITLSGLSKSKTYVFSVCARDRDTQILSHPAPHVEAPANR